MFEASPPNSSRLKKVDSSSEYSSTVSNFSELSQNRLFEMAEMAASREKTANIVLNHPLAFTSADHAKLMSSVITAALGQQCLHFDWNMVVHSKSAQGISLISHLLELLLPVVRSHASNSGFSTVIDGVMKTKMSSSQRGCVQFVCQDALGASNTVASYLALYLGAAAQTDGFVN